MRTMACEESMVKSDEAQDPTFVKKKGGWITLPFLAGSVIGLGLAMSSINSNLIVYLIRKYNLKSIDAAQISNIIRGCMNIAPVVGAIISDAYFGCYPVVVAGIAISLLAFVLFALTVTVRSLLPPPCSPGGAAFCESPSASQVAVLYTAECLLAIGNGGTRYNTATMGADQFDEHWHQDTFFNWYFVFLYVSYIVGDTVIVYVQDSVSWALGFGICIAATAMSLVMMMIGTRYYRRPVPKGSPFSGLARVIVATVRKRMVNLGALGRLQYYHGTSDTITTMLNGAPSESFRFLNRAAMVAPGDTNQDGSIARPWRLCTVQQVEDFKSLIRVLPLWSSGILVSMTVNVQISLTILQALTMDRSLGTDFAIPAASMTVSVLIAFVLFTPLFDRVLLPLWHKYSGCNTLTPLQRIGLGHMVNIGSMAISTLVERRRIHIVHASHAESQIDWVVPMSVLWLVLQLGLIGIEEALHVPGNTALFYQEFPKTLRSTATAMVPLFIAVGSYLSTAFVDMVRRTTKWLPNNMNQSRLDNLYWTLTAVAAVNFGYFLLCASMYTYKNVNGSEKAQMNE